MNVRLILVLISICIAMGQVCLAMNKRNLGQLFELDQDFLEQDEQDNFTDFDIDLESEKALPLSKMQRISSSPLPTSAISETTFPDLPEKANAEIINSQKLLNLPFTPSIFFSESTPATPVTTLIDLPPSAAIALQEKTNKKVPKQLKCPHCLSDQIFNQATKLAEHIQANHQGKALFPCLEPGCSQGFDRCTYLAKHNKTNHNNAYYTCKKCSQIFKYSHYLARHIKIEHNKNTSAYIPITLNTQAATHQDEIPTTMLTPILPKLNNVQASYYNTKYPNSYASRQNFYPFTPSTLSTIEMGPQPLDPDVLKELADEIPIEKTYPCFHNNDCKKSFGTVQQLAAHIKKSHDKTTTCPFCRIFNPRLSDLKNHIIGSPIARELEADSSIPQNQIPPPFTPSSWFISDTIDLQEKPSKQENLQDRSPIDLTELDSPNSVVTEEHIQHGKAHEAYCKHCQQPFPSFSELQRHQQNIFYCDPCNTGLGDRSSYQRHLKSTKHNKKVLLDSQMLHP